LGWVELTTSAQSNRQPARSAALSFRWRRLYWIGCVIEIDEQNQSTQQANNPVASVIVLRKRGNYCRISSLSAEELATQFKEEDAWYTKSCHNLVIKANEQN
jgi:hypothetical protein